MRSPFKWPAIERANMRIAYRSDHRLFKSGDVVESLGDHIEDEAFPEDSRQIDLKLRNRPERLDVRAKGLYLYFDIKFADADWEQRGAGTRTLYAVSFDDKDLLHIGDLEVFEAVRKDMKSGCDPTANVERYWAGCSPYAYSELLVRKATVLSILREASSWRP